jgi:pyrroline-5-carboxylate reductase
MPVGDSIILFGGGRMGLAMLRGWINAGVRPDAISVIDPAPTADLLALREEAGFALNPPIAASSGQILVLAIKPQKVGELSATLRMLALPDTMVISIMAGKTIENLESLCPGAAGIVRAMPNLPAAVGAGATVGVAGRGLTSSCRTAAERLLATFGAFEWLDDEALVDAATGLSGSGPAYLFYLADCMTRAGVGAGLPAAIAERLARATITGAGEMLRQSATSAADLRRDVTSPAGTTEAGLKVWMGNGTLEQLLADTVRAATERARELAG